MRKLYTQNTVNFKATAKVSPFDVARAMQRIVPRIVAAQQEGAAVVVTEAQGYAPVVSGDLRDSIQLGPTELVGSTVSTSVVATAGHAGFVEFGTGTRGEGTYPGELPEEGVPITGEWIYDYRGTGHKGHAAQPFMRPGLDTARGAIIAAYAKRGFKV